MSDPSDTAPGPSAHDGAAASGPSPSLPRRLARRVQRRLDRPRPEARLEQLEATCRALTDELRSLQADLGDRIAAATAARSLLDELRPDDGPQAAGAALRARLDHGLLHAEAVAEDTRRRFEREVGDLRSTIRLTQALVERLPPSGSGPAPAAAEEPSAAAARHRHPTPSFEVLYRAFEDQHRGSAEEISARLADDYVEVLRALPNPELPIVDLGCGRGELVQLLAAAGDRVLGVDANASQLVGLDPEQHVEADLFQWLDDQADGTARAVIALHVVEHLPLDLQVRLVFEGRRVLAEGGLLVLETPNALSLSTAASSFWADPTHERPVHPQLLEFLAQQAGFARREVRPLHEVPLAFRDRDAAPGLVDDLSSLLLGARDIALLAWR